MKKRGDPNRAMKTVPPGLEVRESGIPNAGLGVFATKFFPVRTRFGPYEGRRVTDPDIAHSSGYCWQVHSIYLVFCKITVTPGDSAGRYTVYISFSVQ